MVEMLPADHRALAEARMRYRANAANANDVAGLVPAHLANHPGLTFEKTAYLEKRGLDGLAPIRLLGDIEAHEQRLTAAGGDLPL